MSEWMTNLFGKQDARKSATEAIVTLREQLAMLDKKEEYLEKKIADETKKAKTMVAAKKTANATSALRRKKEFEKQRDQLDGTRMTLETQVNALESAHFNAQTLAAMANSNKALKQVNRQLNMEELETVMADMQEELENVQHVNALFSDPINAGVDLDEDALKQELEDLEQEALDERLHGAERVPDVPTQSALPSKTVTIEEDEEEELRQLQASLAMS